MTVDLEKEGKVKSGRTINVHRTEAKKKQVKVTAFR